MRLERERGERAGERVSKWGRRKGTYTELRQAVSEHASQMRRRRRQRREEGGKPHHGRHPCTDVDDDGGGAVTRGLSGGTNTHEGGRRLPREEGETHTYTQRNSQPPSLPRPQLVQRMLQIGVERRLVGRRGCEVVDERGREGAEACV